MIVLVSEDFPSAYEGVLRSFGHLVIHLRQYDRLGAGVKSHPDLLFFPFHDRLYYYSDYESRFPRLVQNICDETLLQPRPLTLFPDEKYPGDVGLCHVYSNRSLICRKKSVPHEILETADAYGDRIIDVKQGYTACNVADTPQFLITSDDGIFNAVRSSGLNAVVIPAGHIELPPFGNGFIGGCSGFDGERLYFCGSLNLHPGAGIIRELCAAAGFDIVSLGDKALKDYGKMLFLPQKHR